MPSAPLTLFAITPPGVEAITAAELRALGITPGETVHGGVAWTGGAEDVYRANLHLRTATRVLLRLATFRASAFYELERKAKRVPWGGVLSPGGAVHFRVTCHKSRLYHSDAVAQRLAAAVMAASEGHVTINEHPGRDSSDDILDAPEVGAGGGIPPEHHVQRFVVRVDHDVVTISADTSGALLHRRGYRLATAKAPLRETIAAAMLLASGWDRHAPLIDPMCGSGTIAIEGALLARRIAPGRHRLFAFMQWPDFDAARWAALQHDARAAELPAAPGLIRAADRDAGAVQATMANAERAGVAGDVDVSQRAVSAAEPAGAKGWIVTNPPYGVRVGDSRVRNLYARFGDVLRAVYPSWHVGILSADRALERQVGVCFEQVFATSNGGIPVRFVQGVVNSVGEGRS